MGSDDRTPDSPVTDEKTTMRDLRASPVHELAPGTVLAGRYRILGPAGAGGMGAVYEAEQLELRRRVAIKLVLESAGDSFERLRREALGASAVQSPHVVSVFDFHWEEGEPPFLVMELLSGRSLEELMGAEGAVPYGRACRLACEMLDGLGAAHRAGLVHRDVKPSNVWLVPTMTGELVKLLDFGLAKSLHDAIAITSRSGRVMGTRAYLAPEQIHRLPLDPRSDLHAVGVVLWEMIAGRRIWSSQGPEVFAEIIGRAPEHLAAIAPDVPPTLADAVARALAKDPEGRFRNAAEMHAALAPFASAARESDIEDTVEDAPPTAAAPTPPTLPSPGAKPRAGAMLRSPAAAPPTRPRQPAIAPTGTQLSPPAERRSGPGSAPLPPPVPAGGGSWRPPPTPAPWPAAIPGAPPPAPANGGARRVVVAALLMLLVVSVGLAVIAVPNLARAPGTVDAGALGTEIADAGAPPLLLTEAPPALVPPLPPGTATADAGARGTAAPRPRQRPTTSPSPPGADTRP